MAATKNVIANNVILTILVSPNDLNPMIDDFNARQVFVNDTFTLKCLVHIDIGVIVVIEWDYPNKNLTVSSLRVEWCFGHISLIPKHVDEANTQVGRPNGPHGGERQHLRDGVGESDGGQCHSGRCWHLSVQCACGQHSHVYSHQASGRLW